MSLEGGCMCGEVRYVAEGAPYHATICHCADCARASGAPAVAWFTVPTAGLRWTFAPALHRSSPGVRRGFCKVCGTTLTFQNNDEEIDIATMTLDDPGAVPPEDHLYVASAPAWVQVPEGLPRHAGGRPGGVAAGDG